MTDPEPPVLIRTTSYPDGRDEIVTADADGLVETVLATPALSELRPGTISSFRVDPAVLRPEVLVSLMRVSGDDAEDADGWPDDIAQEWVDADEELGENLHRLELVPRWVEVNEQRLTAVRTEDGALMSVLVDKDLTRLESASLLADHQWSAGGGGRPMDTDGGNSIGLLRDGVLYEYQWGDLGSEHAVRVVGATPDEVGAAVADWSSRAELDQAVALTLEPIDPHATLADDERAALRVALDDCGIAFRCTTTPSNTAPESTLLVPTSTTGALATPSPNRRVPTARLCSVWCALSPTATTRWRRSASRRG